MSTSTAVSEFIRKTGVTENTYPDLFCSFIGRHTHGMRVEEKVRFIEELRDVVVAAKADFRLDQIKGDFTDSVGDIFLINALGKGESNGTGTGTE